ncbi:hypothetical protein EYR40_008163 [Pleurotus pulmonarius]|nr:hypothetical protein EYR38_007524 [Pleurotus pulmonarius]KAF4597698.1 hypothetical protein EYR40_008163 [Pleurotus pulmonarius]
MGGVKFELHTNVRTQRSPPDRDRVPELPAPYDLAAYHLLEADRLLREIETGIPSSRKISDLRSDIEDFLQVVICMGSAMDFICNTTPQLSSNSFVERITRRAFGWSRHLKQLPADIRGYQTHIGCYIDADSCLRRIFLSIFEDYRWRPWLRNMRAFVRRSSFSSKVSLAVLSTPACKKIFGEALRSLIEESNLLSTPEIENLTVNTFWDLQHVLSHLCQNGPEEDYIYLGNWEIVHIGDDMVIDKDLFAKTVKAEMRFDISIILRNGPDPDDVSELWDNPNPDDISELRGNTDPDDVSELRGNTDPWDTSHNLDIFIKAETIFDRLRSHGADAEQWYSALEMLWVEDQHPSWSLRLETLFRMREVYAKEFDFRESTCAAAELSFTSDGIPEAVDFVTATLGEPFVWLDLHGREKATSDGGSGDGRDVQLPPHPVDRLSVQAARPDE